MRRRLRRVREIPFSFDSFLDVVANVVGIIIRLILVVWVGARSYSSLQVLTARPATPPAKSPTKTSGPQDPLQQQLAQHRQELAQAQARLLEQLRQLEEVKEQRSQTEGRLTTMSAQRQGVDKERTTLKQTTADASRTYETVALSLDEIKKRQTKLLEDIKNLEKLPPISHQLRYQTPVSRPVMSDEFMFECREGRVTFIDLPTLFTEVGHDLKEKGQLLKTRWQVSDVSVPVGAFRLRYTLERERGLVEAVLPGSAPEASAGYRYGVTEWTVEPVAPVRGETAAAALAPGSEFRRLADALDPHQAVVTFWVYPDSFALFRQLRDYLYERNLVVAGRPLPLGVPIMISRHGTVSRGQ
jgi:hypothetical protein